MIAKGLPLKCKVTVRAKISFLDFWEIFLCYVKSPGNFYCTMIIGNRSSLSTSSISSSLSLFFCLLWTCLCVRNCFLLPKDFPQSSHLCTSCIFMCLFRSFFALNFLLKMGWMVHVFHVSPHWARSKFFAANFTLALFITLLCCSSSEPETLCSSELGFCCCSSVPETLFSSEEGGKVSLLKKSMGIAITTKIAPPIKWCSTSPLYTSTVWTWAMCRKCKEIY